jgi:FAD/FMN-containing dehydrogenase/ferredoxin
MRTSTHENSGRLEGALRERLRGEVRFDRKSRLLYSTDASIYQIEPLGVVLPRDEDDVRVALQLAAEEGVPVLPRGGGTGLAGQTVGRALVLDFSKYMSAILEIDPDRRRARVQPGARLDRLNRVAAAHGLHFGPDPATIRQCAIGGMIGNNACGARSIVYGKTVDHVESLRCLLADGDAVDLGWTSRSALADTPGRAGEIGRSLLEMVEPHRERIRSRYPQVPRRVSGYNFDLLLDEEINLARMIVGSEGTLATLVEAELDLTPLPQHHALVLLAFRDRFASMDAVPRILPERPSALEIVDDRVLRGARDLLEHRASAALVPDDSRAALFVEFQGDTAEEAEGRARDFAARAGTLPGAPHVGVYLDAAEQLRAWALRRAALGLLYRTVGDVKPIPFVEDTGAPPERLGEYTRRFDQVILKHECTSGFFGHAGQGCLHIRVDLNLKDGRDVGRMRRVAEEVADLVVEFGGSLSGEHGDGLARSEFLPRLFGPEIMELHRSVKRVFDPGGRMNPGKIVDPPPMDESLRFGEAYSATPPETFFDYSADGGWDRAVEKCNGMGVCRKLDAGTMCPSYMVTHEEEHATRGRANTLREAMRGNLSMTGPEVEAALDLCLECKACKTECPVGVDMARYKSEFLAQKHRAHGVSREARFFGRIREQAELASRAPGIANLGGRLAGPVLKRLAGVHPDRDLPTLATEPFRRWFERSRNGETRTGTRVVLFDDTFHNFFHPGPLKAAVTVLERAGIRGGAAPRAGLLRPRSHLQGAAGRGAREARAADGDARAGGGGGGAGGRARAQLHPHPAGRASRPGPRRPHGGARRAQPHPRGAARRHGRVRAGPARAAGGGARPLPPEGAGGDGADHPHAGEGGRARRGAAGLRLLRHGRVLRVRPQPLRGVARLRRAGALPRCAQRLLRGPGGGAGLLLPDADQGLLRGAGRAAHSRAARHGRAGALISTPVPRSEPRSARP